MGVAGTLTNAVVISDTLRADAKIADAKFAEMGLPVTMLTGDNARAAHVVAAVVGISRVEAGLMPDDKRASSFRRCKRQGVQWCLSATASMTRRQ